MDFDFAHYMLTGGKVETGTVGTCSPSKHLYRKYLAEIFNMNRTRILAFKNKPPPTVKSNHESISPAPQTKTVKRRRHIPQVSYITSSVFVHQWTDVIVDSS